MDMKTNNPAPVEVEERDFIEADRNGEYFGNVVNKAMNRRVFLKGASASSAALVLAPTMLKPASADAKPLAAWDPASRLTFTTVPAGDGTEPDVRVPDNYDVDVVLRWGDPLFPSAPEFDVNNQTGASQAQQFGFNADLVLWYPLPIWARRMVERRGDLGFFGHFVLGYFMPWLNRSYSRTALMAINHEYTKGRDMFPGYDGDNPTKDQVEAEIQAHGLAVVEVAVDHRGKWTFNRNSAFNRRITGTTPMAITGPLRGSDRMKTVDDATGTEVFGCFNNCAGGKTPWGTILTCEENFDQYFANFDGNDPVNALSLRIPAPSGESRRKWERFDSRFDLSSDQNQYNRYGYVVEIDPYDPDFKPRKHTALGRFKHEGAGVTLAKDNRVAVYSGDDARFEYVYKFVSKDRYRPSDRKGNMRLLEEGTLYVARFDAGAVEGDEMGPGEWLPLVWEPGNVLDQAGFKSQEEVILNTRGAADVLGATPMDRPEDIEVNPKSGAVYVALTNNSRRTGAVGSGATRIVNGREVSSEPNEANPRNSTSGDASDLNGNQHGHVVEIIEDNDDAASTTFVWNIFIKCGDPANAEHFTSFGDIADPVAAGVSPISDPDNLVHDELGNLWISTDGQYYSASHGFGQNDGVFAVPVEGPHRGRLRQFLSGVPGGEICGPEFSGDNRTFFCAIQHPHDSNAFNAFWPVDETVVSKPSLIAVREKHGRKIGV